MTLSAITSTRFWRRLGQHNVIGWPLLAVASIFIAILSFAFDAVRLKNITVLWIPANALSIALVLLVAIPVVMLKRRSNRGGQRQPLFNIVFSSLFFAFKNVSMLYIAPIFGIYDEGVPAVRFLGGIVLGFSVLVLFTNVVGSRLERESSMAKLRDTEVNLRSFREAAFEQLEEENQIAAAKAVSALTPQLEELKISVKQSQDIVSLAHKMSSFIKNELRPFSSELSNDAIKLTAGDTSPEPRGEEEPEPKINLSRSIRVGITLLPIIVLHYLIAAFAIPAATGVDTLTASIVFACSVAVLKIALIRVPDLSLRGSFSAILAVALVAPIPSFYLLSQIPNIEGVPELLPVFYILPGWSVIASSQAYILDQRLSRIEMQLNKVVEELARENKLYEQKAWLARHGWYLLLHGVVQPAITTAAIRASNAPSITEDVKTQILSDLQRALDSLTQNKPANESLEFNISEIKSVWKGICEVDFAVTEEVYDKANSDAVISQVINEILKEVVSNAVRHGNASEVKIQMALDGPNDIEIVAINDGTKPVRDRVESVGSRMLAAICLERSLLWNSTTKKTEFKALIPIK